MTIKKPLTKQHVESTSDKIIDQFIDKGGVPSSQSNDSKKDITFTLTIPINLCKIIDDLRLETKTSRRSWLLQAAQEKINKDTN